MTSLGGDPSRLPPNGQPAPTQSPAQKTRPSKRLRLPLSCTECRRRKKPCDGEVPNCDACRARNVTHLCRWGDDRDLALQQRGTNSSYRISSLTTPSGPPTNSNSYSSSTPSIYNSAHGSGSNILSHPTGGSSGSNTRDSNVVSPGTPSAAAKDARGVRLVNMLAQGDLSQGDTSTRIREDLDDDQSNRSERSEVSSVRPSGAAAKDLLNMFRQHLSWSGLQIYDYDYLFSVCDSGIKDHPKDVEALILLLSASALESVPPSLAISLKYAGCFEEINDLITSWTQNAINLLLALDFYFEPTLCMVQAVNVYQLHLVHRVDKSLMIRLMDLSIRAARRLGIDRLGSAKDDERAWYTADGFVPANGEDKDPLPHHSFGDWAAETFAKRDKVAREIARSHWWILVVRDWSATRQMGSYLVHRSSFTTTAPNVYAFHERDPSGRKEDLWFYLTSCAEISRQFSDLCINAATLRSSAETLYDQVLGLDRQLNDLLDRRPDWLRPESSPLHLWKSTVTIDVKGHEMRNSTAAPFVSAMLWHRLFLIHRPFLALGLCGRDRYRLSANRPLNNAMLLLRIDRQCAADGCLMNSRSVHLLRLLQAALVIISDQFLRKSTTSDDDELLYSDPLIIHETLTDAINTFRTLSKNKNGKTRDAYDDVHKKLEGLLRACARVPENARPGRSSEEMHSIVSPRTWHIDDYISKFVQQDPSTASNVVPPAADMAELWRDLLPFFSV